jgi:hypothetical protein
MPSTSSKRGLPESLEEPGNAITDEQYEGHFLDGVGWLFSFLLFAGYWVAHV